MNYIFCCDLNTKLTHGCNSDGYYGRSLLFLSMFLTNWHRIVPISLHIEEFFEVISQALICFEIFSFNKLNWQMICQFS
jgi:hypothetical protein